MALDELLVEVEAKHAALCHAKAELATALIAFHVAADDRDYRYVQNEVASSLHISRRSADRILSNAAELTERP
ncbi:hypothetical protein, partial [Allokutzneria sp. NRRL B-24872]|uniref:hypothetical protein n=1 Tax=Allokutzneria sp. NRRL B-24872 TaxID=1137961 RepID=UPI001177398F